MPSRRRFLAVAGGVVLAHSRVSALAASSIPTPAGPHPTPRPGITAAKVATADQLTEEPDAIPVFDMVRQIPEVVDGIRCQCGCADKQDYYSLLTCFETPDMMGRHCQVCQAQARLVHRLHKAGKSLDEIRRGIEARFG